MELPSEICEENFGNAALRCPHKAQQLIVTPNNINAAGIVIQYWTQKVHIAIWMGERFTSHRRILLTITKSYSLVLVSTRIPLHGFSLTSV